MARRPRSDSPGAWFHVMNRGIARRTLFEGAADARVFLDHLGAACEREEIEVHAFVLMTTHYHLLARSPRGTVHAAMQRVQTEYSRWFNRGRKRDGPLVRGRYATRSVDSLVYQRTLVRYIDRNPLAAGLVLRAADYPHGSARFYHGEGECPWLTRSWIEGEVCRTLALAAYDPTRYAEAFGRLPDELARVVEARWRSRDSLDPLDSLVHASPAAVVDWMRRKAQLADGTRPGLPIVAPETLDLVVGLASRDAEKWTIARRAGWLVLRTGLARLLCGLNLKEVGDRVGLSRSAVSEIARLHVSLLRSDAEYAQRAASITRDALGVWRMQPGGK